MGQYGLLAGVCTDEALKNEMPFTNDYIKEALRLAPIIGQVRYKMEEGRSFE